MKKAVAGGVGFDLLERGALAGAAIKQLRQQVGRFAQRFAALGVAFGQQRTAGADETERARQQIELGRNGALPQRLGLLDFCGGGVAHGVQLVHDAAQVVKTGAQVVHEQVVLLHFGGVVGNEVGDAGPHQRIAVLHMVLDERQRRAENETVHPQRQPRQLDGKGVQIDAKNAALEQRALQNLRVFGHVAEV